MTATPLTRVQQLAVDTIIKNHGQEAVKRLGDKVGMAIPVISSGIFSVDQITGVGGIPRGRVTEIFGPEHSGKTTLALHVMAQAQKTGLGVALIDAEHALDVNYAAALGVNVDDLFISQPDSGEQGLQIAESWLRVSGAVGLIVIDSVDALVPKAVLEGEIGDSLPAAQARLMSQALRILCGLTAKSGAALIFINQIRMDLKSLSGYGANSGEITSGGRALKFYSSMRIEVRRIGQLKDDDNIYGQRAKVNIVKNKVAVPFLKTEVDLIFGQGIDSAADLLDVGVEFEVLSKRGAWFYYGDERIGQGRSQAIRWMREHDTTEIYNLVKKAKEKA